MTDQYDGQIVEATVSRVEEYGLYFTYGGIEILVLIPEVSVGPVRLKESWNVGDNARVRVVRYVPQEKMYLGSMKDVSDARDRSSAPPPKK